MTHPSTERSETAGALGRRPQVNGSAAVAAGIGFSRLSGLLREMLVSRLIGIGVQSDALGYALRIPNLLQNLLGEGVLSASFVPVYAPMVDRGDSDSRRVAGAAAALLALLTATSVAVLVVFARPILAVLAPAAPAATVDAAVPLLRLAALGTGLLVMSAWCLGVLNSHREFFLPYVAPVLWNAAQIGLLAFVAVRSWSDDADVTRALVWAMAIGSAAQFLVQLPRVRRLEPDLTAADLRVNRSTLRVGAVRDVVGRFWPTVLGRGALQVSVWIDLILASFLATGALTAVVRAQVLYVLPVSLFAMSVAAAALPDLSADADDPERSAHRLDEGLQRIWFWVGFVAAAYLVAPDLIVGVLYQGGDFDRDDTLLVALVLATYAVGLLAISSSRLVQNVLYARGDVRTPAVLALRRVGLAAVVAVLTMLPLDKVLITDGVPTGFAELFFEADLWRPLTETIRENDRLPLRLGAVGLALGAAVGAWYEFVALRRRALRVVWRPTLTTGGLRQLVPPLVVATGVMIGLRFLTAPFDLHRFVAAVVVVGAGGVAYVGIGLAGRWAPAVEAYDTVRRRTTRRSQDPG